MAAASKVHREMYKHVTHGLGKGRQAKGKEWPLSGPAGSRHGVDDPGASPWY